MNRTQLAFFPKLTKIYQDSEIYLNEFEIQNDVESKIGCNQPAAIVVIGMIRRHQNICINI